METLSVGMWQHYGSPHPRDNREECGVGTLPTTTFCAWSYYWAGTPGGGPAKFKVAGCMSATGRERLQEPSLTPTGLGLVALLALGGRFGA